MKPTIGRIVHYTNLGDKDGKYPPEVQSAMVTGVYALPKDAEPSKIYNDMRAVPANQVGAVPDSMLVDLRIFYRSGEFIMQKVPFSESPERGHWNWPPKV